MRHFISKIYLQCLLFVIPFFCLVTYSHGQSYADFSVSYPWQDFVHTTSGGGSYTTVEIANNILTIRFSAGFSSSSLKQGKLKHLSSSPRLPNLFVGPLGAGHYQLMIQDGYLAIYGDGAAVTGFGPEGREGYPITYTIDLNYTYSQNFVASSRVSKEGVTTQHELVYLPKEDKQTTINYVDGLGRPVQQVGVQQSPDGYDVVSPVLIDHYGRETIKALPYVGSTTRGQFHSNAIKDPLADLTGYRNSEQYGFYQSASMVAHDTKPYAQTVFEASPLNRVVEQGATGDDWQPGTGKTQRVAYKTNTAADKIIHWTYTMNWSDFGSLLPNGFHVPGALFITEARDEENYLVKQYMNQQEQVVLKKVFNGNEVLNTYYVYDDFGNLRAVLPPEFEKVWLEQGGYTGDNALNYPGYKVISSDKAIVNASEGKKYYIKPGKTLTLSDGFTFSAATDGEFHALAGKDVRAISQELLNKYVFYYHYDNRPRMVEKHVPGGGITSMVYDAWGRVVLRQDAKQKVAGQWMYIKYDAMNRPVVTGLWSNGSERTIIQKALDDAAAAGTIARNEARDNTQTHGYSLDNAYPTVVDVNQVLTVTYYDDYGFKFLAENPSKYGYTVPTGFTNEKFEKVKGLPTGSRTKVLGQAKWLQSVNYYNERYRLVQTITDNLQDGTDRLSTTYDFAGRATKNLRQHNGTQSLSILKEFAYDHSGRLLNTYQTLNGGSRVLLAGLEYNKLGDLVDKKLHSEDGGANFLQSVDYRYNIRGWMTSINNATLSNDGVKNNDSNDLFGFELKYNTATETGVTSLHNGNIAEVVWNSRRQNERQAYDFTYDGANRLTSASYKNFSDTAKYGRYDVPEIRYDKNGNITRLKRNGMVSGGGYGLMDELSYYYQGNRLLAVNDAINTRQIGVEGFFDNGRKGSVADMEYSYDANGNMEKDENKGIQSISYNHLNMPAEIVFAVDKKISYVYDAAGNKLRKIVLDGTTTTTDYIAGIQYEDGAITIMQHEEGRVILEGGGFIYEYNISDHLGNTRISFAKDAAGNAEIVQEQHYYPFGLTHAGSSYTAGDRNKYLNQGKELQEELELNTYDFHARMYDPAIGRTWQPDPLADMYESYSPYSWVMNNPILIIDPTGMASDTTKANTKDDLNDVKPIEISLAPCECELSVEDIVKAVSNIINGTSESEKKQRYQELEGKRSRGEKLTPSEKQDLEDLEDDIFGWNEQGLLRRNMFGDDWPAESLSKAVRRFAGDEPVVHVTESGKVLYRNPTTGVQVVYDVKGDYFRLEDTTKPGKRVFMDMHGTVPNNVVENGKTRGRNQKEYNQITHFRNIDK